MVIQFPKLKTVAEETIIQEPVFEEVIPSVKKEKNEKLETLSLELCDFSKIISTAEAIQRDCTDHTIKKVTTENFIMNEKGGITYLADDDYLTDTKISEYALGQLGAKIGVPGNYILKCLAADEIELAQRNINTWIDKYGGGFFIRSYKDRIRGILSPRYSVYDTPDILNMIADKVDMRNYEMKGNFINEERLHLRMTSMDKMNIEGEDLFPGIFIDTSDVGRSNLTITFGIYKFVCTNGLVIGKGGTLYKQKHIGINSSEFEQQIAASVEQIPMLIANAEEFVKRAKDKKMDLEKMQAIMKTMHLNDAAQENVIQLMKERYDNTKWGFINGITEVAQQYTLEKRLEIERLAGNVLVAA